MQRTRLAMAAAALLLSACAANDQQDLKQFVADAGENLRGDVRRPPEVKALEPLVYQAGQLSDPFSAARLRPQDATAPRGSQWTPPATHEALEQYPLDALHMVGTMRRDGKVWALIRTPDNVVYRIAHGNRIGQDFGAVTEVTEAAITMVEHVQDGSGLWIERTATMRLQESADAR